MSITSENETHSESEEEDIDGLIASVLQDYEEVEGSNISTGHTQATQSSNKPPTTSSNSNSNCNTPKEQISDQTNPTTIQTTIPRRHKSESVSTNSPNNNHVLINRKRYPISSMDIHNNNNNNSHRLSYTSTHSSHSSSSRHSVININTNNNRHDIKICIKKIHTILSEVDEDKNGEIDYEEFNEGIRNINNNLLPNEIKEMYNQIVWNEYDELNIKLFINLLKQRIKNIKNIHNINKNILTPKYILNIAFKSDNIIYHKSPLPSPEPHSLNNNNKQQKQSLNKIYEILKEKDDDNNLFIDWNEFFEGMIDLGVKMNRKDLKLIYKLLIKKQNSELNNELNNELNIKTFMYSLNQLSNIESMECNQILQFQFTPMIPINRKFNYNNHINKKYSKKKHRHIQSHTNIQFNKRRSNKHNKKQHNRYASLTNINQISIMNKLNCSLIVLSALEKQLFEVDEDQNNNIDYAEFNEVLKTLKSSIIGMNSYKIFYDLTNGNDELNILKFINNIKNCYKLYPTITGDQCIQKCAQNMNNKPNHKSELDYRNSLSSTQSSIIDIDSMCMDDEKKNENVENKMKNIENTINQCDCDENGLIDKQEFIEVLNEYNIYEKFNKNQIHIIYKSLIIRNNQNKDDEASCDLFINKIQEIYLQHPHYTNRKAVYKMCKKLLKNYKK